MPQETKKKISTHEIPSKEKLVNLYLGYIVREGQNSKHEFLLKKL
jgi:hypothetical protein